MHKLFVVSSKRFIPQCNAFVNLDGVRLILVMFVCVCMYGMYVSTHIIVVCYINGIYVICLDVYFSCMHVNLFTFYNISSASLF